MKNSLTFKEFGEYAVLIEWPSKINEETLEEVLQFKQEAEHHFNNKNLEYISAYTSLAVIDVSGNLKASELIDQLQNLTPEPKAKVKLKKSFWKLPVCYEDSFAPDMAILCNEKGLTPEELIELHTKSIYTVYCIGFLPGFMYLGGLPETLHSKRKTTPRLSVEAGSVGIGGSQTGIYPQKSPGGWNIIGNCPVKLFDVAANPPCFVSVGDKVQFYAISKPEYEILEIKIRTGIYKPEKKVWND
jgi:inhibitor of KinA